MGSNRRAFYRLAAVLALFIVVAGACDSTPRPSASPAAPSQTEAAPSKVSGDLALEACDPEGLVACEHQAVLLVEPVAATGLALTYSTEWADGRLDRPTWNANTLGLGGWSLDVIQRYDPDRRILLSGDGSWRVADAVEIGDGERAIPTFDGSQSFVFDAAWRHVRTVDGATGIPVLTFSHDDSGQLLGVHGQRGGAPVDLTVQRSEDGMLTGLLGIDALRTVTGAGSAGTLDAVVRPDGTSMFVAYGPGGLVSTVARTGAGTARFEYDDAGRLSRRTDADGVEWRLAFEGSADASLVTVRDLNDGTASIRSERNADGVRRTVTAADGTVAILETAADGSTTLTMPDGTVTTTGAAPHPVWGMAAPVRTPSIRRLPSGLASETRITTTTNGSPGASTAWQTETWIDGQSSTVAYDPATRTLTRRDAMARLRTETFDALARPTALRSAGKPSIAYAYDDLGRIASVVVGEGPAARSTTFSYDTTTGTVTERGPDGTEARADLDILGRPLRASNVAENVSLIRDAAGVVLQVRAGTRPAASFGYSDAGRPTAYIPPVVDGDASYEITTYTPTGQVATISGPGDRRIEITRDGAGRGTSWTFDRGTVQATYDPSTGLLRSYRSPDGISTALAYDGLVPVSVDWSGAVNGVVSVALDGRLRTTSQAVNGSDRVAFDYDSMGSLTRIGPLVLARDDSTGAIVRRSIDRVEVTHAYDADGLVVSTEVRSAGQAILSIHLTRDVQGRVVRTVVARGTTSRAMTFTYDAIGRLASQMLDGKRPTGYAYDDSGNLVGITGPGAATATYDDRDRLETRGSATLTYDPDGSLRRRDGPTGGATYDVDDLGALRSVSLADGRRVDYIIDGAGRRIGRKVDGILTDGYLYGLDGLVAAWLDGSGKIRARFAYDDNGHLALVHRDGVDLVVVTDQVGSPIALIDSASGEIESTAYDAWGNLAPASAASIPIGFGGGLADPLTGLVRFGARDYDPTIGRWIEPDPLRYGGGDQNLYRYAHGDPVNLADPTGRSACAAGSCESPPADGSGALAAVSVEVGPAQIDEPSEPVEIGPAQVEEPVEIGPASIEPPGDSGSTTVCVGTCAGTGGVSGAVPGSPASCLGLCIPPTAVTSGVCLGVCSGGSEGAGWACVAACFYGEPHLLTADGMDVDFHAAGEFILAKAADGSIEIQARFEPPRASSDVTRGTAVAIRVAGDRVAFYADRERPVTVNGEVIRRAEYARTLPGGAVLERHGTEAFLRAADGTELRVHLYEHFVNLAIARAEQSAGSFTGVLGARDGDSANDLTTRDGVVISRQEPTFPELLLGRFADSWRISDGESLFDYHPGESTASFQRRDIPERTVSIDDLTEQVRRDATALCQAMGVAADPILANCVLDVGLTGDPSYAAGAATIAAAHELDGATADIGTAIERDEHVRGNLLPGTVDRYHFTGVAGGIVYLDALDACTDGVRWRLLRPDGSITALERSCVDIGRRILDQAGEWRLEVYSDSAAGGAYGFTILTVPAPRTAAIAPGGTASGATTAIGEWHQFTLDATAGQVVYLDATAACASPMSWRLLGPDGAIVAFEKACTDLGRRVLDRAGRWTIEAYGDGTATGAYGFTVIAVPAARQSDVQTGQTITGATTQVGEWHRYRLRATAGQVVYLDALGACAPGLSWRLLKPSGELTTFATTCTDIGRRVLDVAGDWTIEVYAGAMEVGAYSFAVIAAPAVRERPIKVGDAISDSIAAVGEWHRYRLPAKAGQKVVIDAGTSCVPDLWWRLLDPDGTLTTFASTCTDSDVRMLDVAGDWVIEIYSDSMATGSYSLTLKPG
jgi:RHS repeat-associated protein